MIKCIIIDDEPLAIELLESHVRKVDVLQLVGKAKNALEAYNLLQEQNVDLMFLDIKMPHLSGIDLLRSLKVRPKVIFTTAYRDFAIDGFELEALDYILKPITFERFFIAVERIMRNYQSKAVESMIMIKSDGLNRKIRTNDIVYIESKGNDVKIFLKDTSYVTKNTITYFTEMLHKIDFVRIHRSFIINPYYVTGYSASEVILGEKSIPVGRSYISEFNEFVKRYSQT